MKDRLEQIKNSGQYRSLRSNDQDGAYIYLPDGNKMLNLSSNDYLGIASDKALQEEFYQTVAAESNALRLSASSSRLLTGNFSIYEKCEKYLGDLYAKSALMFNSGYHANTGILPALASSKDLILADKLVHASIIDGIRLAPAECVRFKHNDMQQLERILIERAHRHEQVWIVTESIFSMDGDIADLKQLVDLKNRFPNVLLYIDEAHAVGVRGKGGLGVCEEYDIIPEVDFIIGTFGKALAGIGAYVICKPDYREWLINTMRTLIFTTALPPVNLYWSLFILKRLSSFQNERNQLNKITHLLLDDARFKGTISQSHIMPLMIGDSQLAVDKSEELQRKGYFALAVRPPTVPKGTSRLRLSLRADLPIDEVKRFLTLLD
ncbi:MAG: aminotransferase class I/II-fold pyridoxal phosphate-dependent enzyme [Bacteroidales bacterium]